MENLDKSFEIVFNDNKKSEESVKIGNEEPAFKIILNESLNKKELFKNPSVVLGEAYMDKVIEIEGDLYDALVTIMDIRKKAMSDEGMLKKVFSSDYNRSEEHTSELQSRGHIVCRLLLE